MPARIPPRMPGAMRSGAEAVVAAAVVLAGAVDAVALVTTDLAIALPARVREVQIARGAATVVQ